MLKNILKYNNLLKTFTYKICRLVYLYIYTLYTTLTGMNLSSILKRNYSVYYHIYIII